MKKVIMTFILVTAMCLGCVSCGNTSADENTASNDSVISTSTSGFEQEILRGKNGYHTWTETENQRSYVGAPSDFYGIPIYKYRIDEQRIQFYMEYSDDNLLKVKGEVEAWVGAPYKVKEEETYTDYSYEYDTYYISLKVYEISQNHEKKELYVMVDNDKYLH